MRYNAQSFFNKGSLLENLPLKISTTLKSLRQAKNWSLDTASKKTAVSKAMLGQIERGESSPTIATLWKIASGFETSFSYFLEDLSPSYEHVIHRTGNLKQMHPQDEKIRVMTIFPYDKELGFEVFIIELLPGCQHISPPHQSGVIEHLVVSEGEIEVLVNNTWHSFKKNEGFRFKADQSHGYRNISNTKAIFYDMIHYNN